MLGKLDDLSPKGIKQGALSDCWFLAGTAAMAEDVKRLEKTMDVNSRSRLNGQGIYRYYYWNFNKWVAINIDDKLPVQYKYSNSKDYFSTTFAHTSTFGASWMPLFEKAYSKFIGNYDRIEWGLG